MILGQSARLLGHLIRASGRLARPYVQSILEALLPKLTDPNQRVSSNVLAALGELSRVAEKEMLPHLKTLIPIVMEALQDQSKDTSFELFRL